MVRTVLVSLSLIIISHGLPFERFTAERDFIDAILNDGTCIKTIDEGLEIIKQGVDLLEESNGDIDELLTALDSIGGDANLATTTRATADVLRRIDQLLPRFSEKFSSLCSSSSEAK